MHAAESNSPTRDQVLGEPAVSGSYRLAARSQWIASNYREVERILTEYISPILVASVLGNAQRRLGLDPENLSKADLRSLVEDTMVGLRLFVPEYALPRLKAELDEILQEL